MIGYSGLDYSRLYCTVAYILFALDLLRSLCSFNPLFVNCKDVLGELDFDIQTGEWFYSLVLNKIFLVF